MTDSIKVGRVTVKRVNGEDFPEEGQFKGGPYKTAMFLYMREGERGPMFSMWVPKDSPVAAGFGVTADSKGDYWVNFYPEDGFKIVATDGQDDALPGVGPAF